MNSIPASQLVRVFPSVLAAGGNPLALNAVMFTRSASVPLGFAFAAAPGSSAGDYFGPASLEAILAGIYFDGFDNATSLPNTLYFVRYNDAAAEAYLRSGSFAAIPLTALQGLAGTLIVSVNGKPVTSANIDLSTAASFTNAAALIQAGLQTPGGIFAGAGTIDNGAGGAGNTLTITAVTSGAVHLGDAIAGAGVTPGTVITAFLTGNGGVGTYTVSGVAQHIAAEPLTVTSTASVTYDAQLHTFLIHSPTTGPGSTIDYATGTIAAGLQLQAVQGAVISVGAAAATPAGALAALTGITQNFATFMHLWEPTTADKLLWAEALQAYNDRYAYVAWDSDQSPLVGDAPASFGAQCKTAGFDGLWVQYEPATDAGNGRKAAFICGTTASIDFDQPGGRITFAYKGQSGLTADIASATQANNLKANGYNFYGAYATANDLFRFTQPGTTPGKWKFFDSYINQIWLNNNCQLSLLELLASINHLPYNAEGDGLLRTTLQDPITRAKVSGVITAGVPLSNSQRAQVNLAAGTSSAADTLETTGVYLLIKAAPPEVRAVRGSPPMTLWYMDGGSMQELDLASVNVQ